MTHDKLLAQKKAKKIGKTVLIYIVLILVAALCAGPFIWMFSASFKSGQNIYDMSLFTAHPTAANYKGVMEFMNLPQYFMNTVIITFSDIILDVVLASMCAYAMACMEFTGKKVIMSLFLAAMIIPAAAGMIINYLVISKAHLLNTFAGVILPGAVKIFSIVLLRQAYLTIPKEIIEAGRIDGAGELLIWRKLMMPSVMPTITTIIIFDFISKWNEFLWPIIVMQDPAKYPLATALQYLNGSFNYKFGYIAAGTIISIIPVIVVFVAFQKNYIEAVGGAIKG